jgi:hypothetical protein
MIATAPQTATPPGAPASRRTIPPATAASAPNDTDGRDAAASSGSPLANAIAAVDACSLALCAIGCAASARELFKRSIPQCCEPEPNPLDERECAALFTDATRVAIVASRHALFTAARCPVSPPRIREIERYLQTSTVPSDTTPDSESGPPPVVS